MALLLKIKIENSTQEICKIYKLQLFLGVNFHET